MPSFGHTVFSHGIRRPLWILTIVLASCAGSDKGSVATGQQTATLPHIVGGPFENSEFMFQGMPEMINAVDTSPGWTQQGQQILITGRVLQPDAETPAAGVLLYYYQTNVEGRYQHLSEQQRSMPPDELGRTHGYIRGWVKTDSTGSYSIYTVRPGSYPTRDEPAHIHASIKEPNGINEYYIDDFVFDDDPILTSVRRRRMENRCGSGVLRLARQGDLLIGERDIILGLNIPDHPERSALAHLSGLQVGEDVKSFIPFHAWGPDKGTRTCPICKYGWYNGVLYFVGNHPDWPEITQWLKFLEDESRIRDGLLKVYFIYGKEHGYAKGEREKELARLGSSLGLERVALTFVPSLTDTASEIHFNRIDPDTDNTIVLYKRSRVIASFTDLKPSEAAFTMIRKRIDSSNNEYFRLPRPEEH